MHSAELQNSDFKITENGRSVLFATFVADFTVRTRLGLYAPNRVDGLGAIALVMLFVTAFYDLYRAKSDDFYAYPDFYTFQNSEPLADYGMLDIWPEHKNVACGSDPIQRLSTINDRCINILLLPDQKEAVPPRPFEKAQLESAKRNINRSFVYSFDGQPADADLTIEAPQKELYEWAMTVFDTKRLVGDKNIQQMRAVWTDLYKDKKTISQSFKSVTLDSALKRL